MCVGHGVDISVVETVRVQRTSARTLYGAAGPENSKKKTQQRCFTETLKFVASPRSKAGKHCILHAVIITYVTD